MSFLAPFFLIGCLAIAAPIIFHLIRRTSKENVPFSSLMFLQPSPPRVTKRSRLENLFLLLLRCLILALLALGFARPFISAPVDIGDEKSAGKKIVVLVDASASMKREGLWEAAQEKAAAVMEDVEAADRVALYVYDRQTRAIVSFDQWSEMSADERAALSAAQLKGIEPSWSSTLSGNALVTAVEAMEEADSHDTEEQWNGERRIVLISDLQAGSRLEALQAYEWPEGVELKVESVKAKKPTNAGIQLVLDNVERPRNEKDDTGPRVRVSNAAESAKEQFQVGWVSGDSEQFLGAPIEVYVPPGQSRVVQASKPPQGLTGARLLLKGDEEPFDNTAWHAIPNPREIGVIYFGSEKPTDTQQPLFYINRAFQETRQEKVAVRQVTPGQPISQAELEGAKMVIIGEPLSESSHASLKAFAEKGNVILLLLKNEKSARSIGLLTGINGPMVEEAEVDRYAMLGEVDFEHPLFAPFADPRYSDFTKIRFWKYRRIQPDMIPDARTLARYDNGDAALAEIPVGRGQLVVFTAGWHPADSQLSLSSKFVPLLYSILERGGGLKPQVYQYEVGDTVSLDEFSETDAVTVTKPDGSSISLAGGKSFNETQEPGLYTLASGQTRRLFAVNLSPFESKTAPRDAEELALSGALTEDEGEKVEQTEDEKRLLLKSQLENRQKLWRWVIVGAMGFLILETFVAGRLSRPVTDD